jgi:histidine decarboxylase
MTIPNPPTTTDNHHRVTTTLAALRERLQSARRTNIGFPGATDFDYAPLTDLLTGQLLNNIGDPWIDGVAANHTKPMEREVVEFLADLFRAPADDRWGYVTTGGTEGNLYALHLARSLYPQAVCYYSDAAHYSIAKSLTLLAIDAVRIRADAHGEIDYLDLAAQIGLRRHRPAIVVATAGTTMTEAVDDVRRISHILDELAVRDRFIHTDAALSGVPLALLDPDARPGFDFADGTDSISTSGHKFTGSPTPSGIVIVRATHRARVASSVEFTATPDTTITGSRSGHAPLMIWYAIHIHGRDGLRRRADQSRQLAAYTKARLDDLGWPSHRHNHAFTVALKTPPESVLRKWVLATHNGWSHVIAMPGITTEIVDEFIQDLADSLTTTAQHGRTTKHVPPAQPRRTHRHPARSRPSS